MRIIRPGELDAPPDLRQLGGKALSLYRLGRLDRVMVPPWFAASAEMFGAAIERTGIGPELEAALAVLAAAGPGRNAVAACVATLTPLLEQLRVDPDGAAEIGAAYRELGGGYVSVRSSAIDEDGSERSFAGCLDTALFVRGESEVVAAVEGCWRSAFSERSLTYRAAHGALSGQIRVATVIQQMIDGRVSGVLFTADPSTGARDRALVTATWGLGEGVVSGRLACDTFVIERASGAVLERDVAVKSHAIRRDPARGAGTLEVEVAEAEQRAPTLEERELAELVELGRRIEEAYQLPVDVEWTYAGDQPWILQARPITTGAGRADRDGAESGRRRLWDNSNIIESYSGVTTPLTYSFARRAYSIVYRLTLELLGVSASAIQENDRTFEQMIGLLGGRIYYNLESWHTVLKLLPGYQFNAEFMDQMMGVAEKSEFDEDPAPHGSLARRLAPRAPGSSRRSSPLARRYLVELPRLVASLTQLAHHFSQAQKLIEEFFVEFGHALEDLDGHDLSRCSLDQLVDLYLEAERRMLQRWQAPILNDTLAMIYFGALRKVLVAWGLGEKQEALHNDLLCGEGGLESTEPTRNLLALMADVRRDPALCALIAERSPAEIRTAVDTDPRFGWLAVRIADHVDRFGDRCVDELKLEEPTLRDDPTFLYAAIKGYLSAPPITVDELETRERKIRSDAEARAHAALRRRPDRRRLFDWLLGKARLHVKNRENLRFARTRAFGLIRRLVVAMGQRLAEAGRLDRADDVFYLEIGELIGYARGTATTTDLRGLAGVRRREFERHRAAAPLPDRFSTEGAVYLDPATSRPTATAAGQAAVTGTVLEGIGASPGVVRARARVITDPRTAELYGDVLVANRTDPGWVPLFPNACAVVVERGSVLSHSAIVAREFGIPCVVGVAGALTRLRDGQEIEVDGNAGRITALED